MKKISIKRVSSTDVEGMRELAKMHEATGMPFIVHDEKLAQLAQQMELPELGGLLKMFGTVGEGYGTNFQFKRASVMREQINDLVCNRMGLCSADSHQGERFRLSYHLKGKEFHAGPGFNFKILLMLQGSKQWDLIDPKYTPLLDPSEEGMCGMRICVTNSSELELKLGEDGASHVEEYLTGIQNAGDILVLSSQWWHSTHNQTPVTAMLVNKYKNTRIYNETIHAREQVCKINVDDGTRNCKKSKHNELGSLKWSCGFFDAGEGM